MKFLIVALFVAVAAATSIDQAAQVIRSSYDQTPEGNYQYAFETDNKIAAQAVGTLKTIGQEAAVVVSGSNQYVNPEGQAIETSYVADEFGYQPQGAHLPTPPAPQAIPDYILRSLEYIKAHPYVEKKL